MANSVSFTPLNMNGLYATIENIYPGEPGYIDDVTNYVKQVVQDTFENFVKNPASPAFINVPKRQYKISLRPENAEAYIPKIHIFTNADKRGLRVYLKYPKGIEEAPSSTAKVAATAARVEFSVDTPPEGSRAERLKPQENTNAEDNINFFDKEIQLLTKFSLKDRICQLWDSAKYFGKDRKLKRIMYQEKYDCDLFELIVSESFMSLNKQERDLLFVEMAPSIVGAVDLAHSENIIHHDIKLENFFAFIRFTLEEKLVGAECFLADFGNAQLASGTPYLKDGTTDYFSPEKMRAHKYLGEEINPRKSENKFASDIWALGVCLYIIYCGGKIDPGWVQVLSNVQQVERIVNTLKKILSNKVSSQRSFNNSTGNDQAIFTLESELAASSLSEKDRSFKKIYDTIGIDTTLLHEYVAKINTKELLAFDRHFMGQTTMQDSLQRAIKKGLSAVAEKITQLSADRRWLSYAATELLDDFKIIKNNLRVVLIGLIEVELPKYTLKNASPVEKMIMDMLKADPNQRISTRDALAVLYAAKVFNSMEKLTL